MRTVLMALIAGLLFFNFETIALAANVVYMPVVLRQVSVAAPVRQPHLYMAPRSDTGNRNATFQLDHVRLWSPGEGKRTPDTCSARHKLHVHVFDALGDSGADSRLNGVIVQVVHWENGQRIEEFRPTGLSGQGRGVAEFELRQFGEVRVFTDSNGAVASSHSTTVATLTEAIAFDQLIVAGYCTDYAGCWNLVNAGTCHGQFSWNVVFKRSY
jgi:hypothetical protein